MAIKTAVINNLIEDAVDDDHKENDEKIYLLPRKCYWNCIQSM